MSEQDVSTFSDLLSPLEINAFFSEYWGTKFLLIGGNSTKFATLLTAQGFEQLIAENASFLAPPRVTMYSGGTLLHDSQFTSGEQVRISGALGTREEIRIDLTKIKTALSKGATLKISQVDKFSPKLKSFSDKLATELNERIHLNLYFSSPNTNAFTPHFDKHDVFILQLYGEKLWSLFDYQEDFPIQGISKKKTRAYLESNKHDIRLSSGDLLYIPRGMWHYAHTGANHSLHITVGVEFATSIDLMRWIANQLAEDSIFRMNLPITPQLPTSLQLHIVRSIEALLNDKEKLAEFRRERSQSTTFINPASLSTLPNI